MVRRSTKTTLLITGVLFVFSAVSLPVSAAKLTDRSWRELSSVPGATTDYNVSFTVPTSGTLGSLGILICANTPLEGDNCDIPAGMDMTNAQLTDQTGITDFNLFVVAPNSLLLSRTASPITAPRSISFTLRNVVNPSTIGSYYVRLATYSSTNGTGSSIDYGGLAFAVTNNLQITSVVPPYLVFCAAVTIPAYDCASGEGDYINFGNFSPAHSSQATSQLLAATNASNGYNVQVYGTTMTSGNNVIDPISAGGDTSRPGRAQFGINLRANSTPAVGSDISGPGGSGQPTAGYDVPNRYQYESNDIVAGSAVGSDYKRYTVTYLVNVPVDQAPGVYASSLTYVGSGNF